MSPLHSPCDRPRGETPALRHTAAVRHPSRTPLQVFPRWLSMCLCHLSNRDVRKRRARMPPRLTRGLNDRREFLYRSCYPGDACHFPFEPWPIKRCAAVVRKPKRVARRHERRPGWALISGSNGSSLVRGRRNPDSITLHRCLAASLLGAARPLAGLMLHGSALAGAPTWPYWPGAVRHVQGETLKALRPVIELVSTSRLPAVPALTVEPIQRRNSI